MKGFTAEETELMMNSLDLTVANVSNGISQLQTIEQKINARELIKKLLALINKLSDVPTKQ